MVKRARRQRAWSAVSGSCALDPSRHPFNTELPRPQGYSAYCPLQGAVADAVQEFLAGLSVLKAASEIARAGRYQPGAPPVKTITESGGPHPASAAPAASEPARALRRSPLHVPPSRNSGIATILPLRMIQANATAAAEQSCAAPIRASVGSRSRLEVWASERGIGHQRHVMPLAPWQQVMFKCHAHRDYKEPDWWRSDRHLEYAKSSSMLLTLKLDTPQARIFPAERKPSKAFTTPERSEIPFGQCNR